MQSKDIIVVKHMLEHKTEDLNMNQLAKNLKMDYKNIYTIVKRLQKESVITLEKFGKAFRIRLTQKLHPLIFQAEYERRQALLKNKNLLVMLNQFKESLKSACYIMLLFGSHAKKRQNKHSDIDLMFIVPDKTQNEFEKNADRTAALLPLPLHCLVFSESQFARMKDSKEPNVTHEAIKHNIIMHGIEPYYELAK